MVRWYHAIFSAYGYWLPNDPRGSWSDFVQSWELYRFRGSATKVCDKRSYAHDPHDARFRLEAKEHLKYPAARFDAPSRDSMGRGFSRACSEFGFRIHACAIGYDPVHVPISHDPERTIENIVAVLKARATHQMNADGTHPMKRYAPLPTPWGRSCWSVFINEEAQLHNAIGYVERHPVKEGLAPQHWEFITPCE